MKPLRLTSLLGPVQVLSHLRAHLFTGSFSERISRALRLKSPEHVLFLGTVEEERAVFQAFSRGAGFGETWSVHVQPADTGSVVDIRRRLSWWARFCGFSALLAALGAVANRGQVPPSDAGATFSLFGILFLFTFIRSAIRARALRAPVKAMLETVIQTHMDG